MGLHIRLMAGDASVFWQRTDGPMRALEECQFSDGTRAACRAALQLTRTELREGVYQSGLGVRAGQR